MTTAPELNQTFADWARERTPDEKRSFADYQGGLSSLINDVLWDPAAFHRLNDGQLMTYRSLLKNLTTAIIAGSGLIPEGTVVYRGITSTAQKLRVGKIEEAQGHSYPVKGFSSTTANRAVSGWFASRGPDGAELFLALPVGIPAAWLPLVGDPDYTWEGELLLPPGLEMAVEKIEMRDGFGWPIIHAEVRV